MFRLKQLGKDTLIYGIGGILAKSVSFFLLPIYTRIFTPADYGTIEMLTVISSFLSAIMVMGMDSAQSMYFFKFKKNGKIAQAKIVSAILQWRLLWGVCIVLLATLIAPILNAWFFQGKLSLEYFAIAFVGALFIQIMKQSAEVMRLLYRPWGFIGITLSQSVLSAILILSFVILFDQGILGFFLGTGIASVAMAIIGWLRIRDYWQFKEIHFNLWSQLIRFGAPLMPAGMAIYFISTADRWFIQYYHGPESLGVYAIGAKFVILLTLVVETFRKAWWPIAMDSMHSKDGPETFRTIARLYMGLATSGIVLLTAFSPFLVRWLTAPAFHDAWPIVGVLAWQAVFYGFFLIATAGIWKTEKMYLNLYLMGGAVIISLFLNWVLVPVYGSMGAAISTSLTYFLLLVVSMILSEKLWKINISIIILGFQILLGSIFVAWFVYGDNASNPSLVIWIAFLVASILLMSSIQFSKIKRLIIFLKAKK